MVFKQYKHADFEIQGSKIATDQNELCEVSLANLEESFLDEIIPALKEFETYLVLENEEANFQKIALEQKLVISKVRAF